MRGTIMQVFSGRLKLGWWGWWRNKPPVQRSFLWFGLISMVGLITIGLALDRNLLRLKTMFPSLDPFIWDLAKGVTLGTITIAILDDVRSWGLSWRILRANLTSLNEVVARLNNILYNHIGLNWRCKSCGIWSKVHYRRRL